jgi:predicted dehydrogenase
MSKRRCCQTTTITVPEMTVRWGIAAPGRIAAQFADGLAHVDGAEIVAVGSRSIERADAFGDRFAVPHRHGSYEDLMADPTVEVVYVATPHAQHEAVVLMALEAGKHVLCEKPFALNGAQATRMVEAARARGLFAMEALWSRFLPGYRVMADVLRNGRIGEPLVVEADFGFRAPLVPENRLFDLAQGGGALLDLGIYPLQLCSMVLGSPDSVVAEGHVGETGADEEVAAVLHHTGGRLGAIKAATRVGLSCTARISGTDGWIELPAMMHRPTRVGVGSGTSLEWIDAPYEGEGLRFQAEEVQSCIAAGRTESEVVPLDETIALARTMDDIREQIGVVYPADSA